MADCKLITRCPIFNDKMNLSRETGTAYKEKYCQGDNTDCARYTLFRNNLAVPPDLLPEMLERANELLKEK
ncbi:MAG: hypothetical protein GX631_04065 [Dehalococcoidales bacterium]|jgi:hypothetical protein|nr:hypothetical protein [Dehalococcoidales bacterium]